MRLRIGTSGSLIVSAGIGVAMLVTTAASGQTASALLREDDVLVDGETISALNNTAVNHVGGYACSLTTAGESSVSRIWGAPDGGLGMLLRSESTIGIYEQTSFESFYGMSDLGELCYGPSSVNLDTGETGLDGLWLDDMPILTELDPVPSLPGSFSTFNSRPLISGNGIPQWVGGITDTQGGGTQTRVLYRGVGAMPLIMGGDSVTGVPEPIDPMGGSIDFDHRLSRFGMYWINRVDLDAPSAEDGLMVINGAAVMAGGGLMREGQPIPASLGGLPDENWDNFDFLGINDAMDFFVTGDTDGDTSMDEFVSLNGEIVLREGAVLDLGGSPVTLAGSIEGGYMNKETDWAVIWDIDDVAGDNFEALIFNGEILLVEGDPVDWNGDGVIDGDDNNGVIANFTGISALTVGSPAGGFLNIYFTADIDFNGTSSSSDDLEGFFCLAIEAGPLPAFLDIKPGSCPNSFNRRSNGVLPAALLGADDFDVTSVDLATLLLGRADGVGGGVAPNDGPPGPHPTYDDVATPFFGDDCNCHEMEGDGLTDIMLHFRTQEVVDGLEMHDLPAGALVTLVLRGFLLDGTPFEAFDCVRLVPPGAGPMSLVVGSTLPDAWVDVLPLDLALDGGGFAQFTRTYPESTQVTLIAPTLQDGRQFAGWAVPGTPGLVRTQVLTIDLGPDSAVSAVYGKAPRAPAGNRPVTSTDASR